MVNVAINGFGRIGRNFLRASFDKPGYGKDFNIVGINDLTDAKTLAHLLKYDSVHGKFDRNIKAGKNFISVNNKKITVLSERDPADLPWAKMDIDAVVESTGFFRDRDGAGKHLEAGAKKVIISAPGIDPDMTVVMGVNHKELRKKHKIISNASCTTNSIAPPISVLNDTFGVKRGLLTTTHAYTSTQKILDLQSGDLRKSRASAVNIIPSSTGAAKAIALVIPELKGKLDGMSLRVPVPDGSISDLTMELKKQVTREDVNGALKKAAGRKLKGYMEYSEEPLVSTDIIGNPHSSIIDSQLTNVIMGKSNFIKIMAWYDNEWGFSNRLGDLIKYALK